MSNPAQAEATGQPITFEYAGETYSVAPTDEWDVDAMEAYEAGNIVTCVRLLIGEAQYRKFKPAGAKRTLADLRGLFDAIQTAADVPN
ncbi:hypothetical protein GA0070616_4610 [Micromonospora nigra]|uniref:Tail assembly chaperone n=1 Tax=Micromonospora nigra TaxID=145857 RepID=A0A1C6SUS2_9ACTN|nr:hypothetical protein [Micromonospora nigra]SCL33003.1 hypothetical protein GA0070616_4610 [Micromonospora nigra]